MSNVNLLPFSSLLFKDFLGLHLLGLQLSAFFHHYALGTVEYPQH